MVVFFFESACFRSLERVRCMVSTDVFGSSDIKSFTYRADAFRTPPSERSKALRPLSLIECESMSQKFPFLSTEITKELAGAENVFPTNLISNELPGVSAALGEQSQRQTPKLTASINVHFSTVLYSPVQEFSRLKSLDTGCVRIDSWSWPTRGAAAPPRSQCGRHATRRAPRAQKRFCSFPSSC